MSTEFGPFLQPDEDEPTLSPDGFDSFSRQCRLIEALLFASAEPVSPAHMRERLPADADLGEILTTLQTLYAARGVNLVEVAGGWAMRTAPDLTDALRLETEVPRRLSRAAMETLAIIAYHQPVTRADIEQIRAVAISKGTLDILLEAGWIRPGGRRRSPGRPLTWVTSAAFLDHFGLGGLEELPGIDDLKAAGLLDGNATASETAWPGSQEVEDDTERDLE